MTPSFSHHGCRRQQKRAVSPLVIDWLVGYGRSVRRHGADVYFFDKTARRTLQSDIGALAYRRLVDQLNAYVVMSDEGKVITAGWRTRRVPK